MHLLRKTVLSTVFFVMLSAGATYGSAPETPPGWTPVTRRIKVNTSEGDQEIEITYYRNAAGMDFVWIPPGKYWRGSRMTPQEVEQKFGGHDYWFEREHPRHKVELTEGFWLGSTPVTQAQWTAVMDSNPSYFAGDDRPVENVSWNDAAEFTRKLSKMDGVQYRLPTEAEWEYAARAGTETEFHFGEESALLGDYGWYSGNSLNKTHPVGLKAPNAWGLYDMHGNVWEWCSDWYGGYCSGPVFDPKGGEEGEYRVLRGGSWFATAGNCRSARRRRVVPDHRGRGNGLRVAVRAVARSE